MYYADPFPTIVARTTELTKEIPLYPSDSAAMISKCLSCPYSECVDCYNSHSIPRMEKKIAVKNMAKEGKPVRQICSELNISMTTYYSFMKEMKGEKTHESN